MINFLGQLIIGIILITTQVITMILFGIGLAVGLLISGIITLAKRIIYELEQLNKQDWS
jgi:hypothetical protein